MNYKYIPFVFGILNMISVQGQISIVTQRGNNQRTGSYTNEKKLNTSNVNVKEFGRLYNYPVDGQVYAQPLYVSGLNITGKA